ncbi:MAG: Cell shape-determining protein MreC precursor [Firmicutes bacterium ADurb.Bin193]|nr:MAG: Cell shape-determining protein MreC precursor [Firmicutes bacterium ADurb.Bin193]
MKDLFTNKYFILLLVITVLILVMAALYTAERQSVTFGEDLVASVITPVQSLATAASQTVIRFAGYFGDIDRLRTENERMQNEINELSDTVRTLEQYRLENERLREMLNLKDNAKEYNLVASRVIAKDPGGWFNSFTIDKGTSDGLAYRMPVITSAGLVGHIYEIGSDWAKVITIIDSGSSVGATVARTRDVAVVESDIALSGEGLCKMTYLSKSSTVITGDIIETSGLGGIYPKGLLIGKVREIRSETAGISQYAIIEPAVDFGRISEVFVITNHTGR